MNRITNTDKWKDDWFLSLVANAKFLFIYLCENCDDAGFYKLNSAFMSKQTGIPPKYIVLSLNSLKKAIVFNNSSDKNNKKVWIKNFLFYQQQLPLELNNLEHKKIKMLLEKNLEEFDNNEDMLYILDKMSNSTSQKKTSKATKFLKPTIDEFKEYGFQEAYNKKIKIDEKWVEQLYNHYESNGWKVGGKTPMKDWKAAMKNALGRELLKIESNTKKGKISQLIEINEMLNS